MYKNYRYINAGENEFYRWGHKAVDRVKSHMEPNEKGFYSIPADGGKYWTFGTSDGKYGKFARWYDTCFSVNSRGYIWAKEGTEKADRFIEMLETLIFSMEKKLHESENRNAEDIDED